MVNGDYVVGFVVLLFDWGCINLILLDFVDFFACLVGLFICVFVLMLLSWDFGVDCFDCGVFVFV